MIFVLFIVYIHYANQFQELPACVQYAYIPHCWCYYCVYAAILCTTVVCVIANTKVMQLPVLCPLNCRQMELESRFNEAYSQSLSMKDERIQVLERRIEDLVSENEQLKDEISLLKRQNERMQRKTSASNSPNTSFT